ncbi:uncharacterized protein RB166_006214 [Leptodactylus fuscus]
MKATAGSSACVNTSTNARTAEEPILLCDALVRSSPDRNLQVPLKGKTPVSVPAMQPWLEIYPNREASAVLSDGFVFGFFIPFIPSDQPYFSRNLKSARDLPSVLRDKIYKEVSLGRIVGPFSSPPFHNLRVSPLGIVPKKESGKFRLIHHLSHPKGSSVNDGISRSLASVSYVSFDRAVSLLRVAGPGALMAKSDIESAFRLLPVHPVLPVLGCSMDGQFYFDSCLPMGCSISCHFFELFSSFLEWVVRYETKSRSIIHYLDDFLFVGPAFDSRCQFLLDSFRSLMSRFGVPLSPEKTVGPTTVLSFLGIELDSVSMVFRLPGDKLERLSDLLRGFLAVSKVTLKQMQSLLGLLVFTCRVMPMGRVFSRRLSLSTRGISSPYHRIRLTRSLKSDLSVWLSFLEKYNGRTCMQSLEVSNQDISLYTDAAGSLGFGAILGREWCASSWPPEWAATDLCKNLTLLELFPIVVSVILWGPLLRDRRVTFWCDNESVVHAINNLTSSSLPVLSLLRHMVLRCLEMNIWFRARHVPGCKNNVADALSRFNWQVFRELLPEASEVGLECPPYLWDIPTRE